MSNHLGVKETLDLLNTLQRTVREFAAAEDRLQREFQGQAATQRTHCQAAVAKLRTESAASVEHAEAALQSRRAEAQAKREQRMALIARAARISRKRALDQVRDQEGRRTYELQKSMLGAQRTREADLARTDTAFEEFSRQLAANREAFVLLEQSAQTAFRGYLKFRRLLVSPGETAAPDLTPEETQLLAELDGLFGQTAEALAQFRKFLIPRVFQLLPLWSLVAVLVGGHLAGIPLSHRVGPHVATPLDAAISLLVLLTLLFLLYHRGKRRAGPLATTIARALEKARRLHQACLEKSETRHRQELERIETGFKRQTEALDRELNRTLTAAAEGREAWPGRIEEKVSRASAKCERLWRAQLEQLEREHADAVRRLEGELDARVRGLAATLGEGQAKLEANHRAQWQALEVDWQRRIQSIYAAVDAANAAAESRFPPWGPDLCEHWTPPGEFEHAAKFARLEVDVARLAEALPQDPRLALPGPPRFSLPLLLTYPRQGSILFETPQSGPEEVVSALNNILLRLLSTAPPGRLSFTILDPVGLGQNFAGIMHLADHAEHLINSRIWTQTAQIEQQLADLNEHLEKEIQMKLRNEYQTIAEYNERAGNIAEKYHFLVIADFPVNFSDTATKRLLNIVVSGARCGVYTLIHWDRRQALPPEFVPEELRRSSVGIGGKADHLTLAGQPAQGVRLILDPPPGPELATAFIQEVGLRSKDSNRVEVPFAQVAPAEPQFWTADTTAELRVPIGRTGATKLQYLAIGKDTRQHVLIAGKTGSGKSTLFHVLITSLASWCSPEQVEFYLVDFKKGVEFKCYATHRLPHARVVAIESDRDFGLSVLQRVDDELKRRGDLFRELGVQDLAGYKKAGAPAPLPRSLLIIDEFQEFFVEDDKIAQTASVLLDRIVRQGRAFGIHVLLGSQTLGGAYTLARTTLGQMVIRIALQCNEADAYLIMDDGNAAPRLLSRPGEGIYNDAAGALEGNSPFQTVWLPDDVREQHLKQIRDRADRSPVAYPSPIVFEGNSPADVRENPLLRAFLEAESLKPAAAARIWLGAPNSIKGPTEAVFRRQSGSHLLVVGQRDEAVLGLLSVALVSLAAQHPPGTVRFLLFEGSPPESSPRESLDRIVNILPHGVTVARPNDLAPLLQNLAADLRQRADDTEGAPAPTTYLFIHGLQRFGKLRFEEDFGFSAGDAEGGPRPAALLNQLISEGARLGIHLITTCDTYANASRFLGRKALGEFGLRVLFQMSPNDSAILTDSPKASLLGLHRALFYNEPEGYLETFRPYAMPRREWIEEAARNLARLLKPSPET